ncbi:hypothetical protein Dimus_001289 [Dionaea muscipula]
MASCLTTSQREFAAFIREEEGSENQLLPGQERELGFAFSFPQRLVAVQKEAICSSGRRSR